MRAREAAQVQVDRIAGDVHPDGVDEAMRNLCEPRPQAEFVKHPQGARVHRVPAEVTQEVSVLFHHRDFYAGAGQQQAEHHARRSAAGDETGRRLRFGFSGWHAPILAHWSQGAPANSVSTVNGFLNWWDGNELWLSGLAFVLQAMVVIPVVLVVAYLTAVLLDAVLGRGIALMRRARHADGTSG